MIRVFILLLLIVPLQFVKAQSIITLAPQSNCSNNVYVDYIAKIEVNESKNELHIKGQLFTNADSIKSLTVIANKGLQTINGKKEKLKSFIKKIKVGEIEKQYSIHVDSVIQQTIQTLINGKELQIDLVLTQINIVANIEIELLCCFEFKNGCKYIKRQKVIL